MNRLLGWLVGTAVGLALATLAMRFLTYVRVMRAPKHSTSAEG